jgi:fibronectin-binding autotransporter adhesin
MIPNPFRKFVVALTALVLHQTSQAETFYWDGGTVTVNGASGGTAGTWTVGAPGWENGTSAQNWATGNDALLDGTAGTVTLGGAISASSVAVNTTGYTLALANNTLTTGSLNYGGAVGGSLILTGGNGTSNTQNVVTLDGAGTGWVSGTSVNLTGSGNPAAATATQNGPLLKVVFGNASALGSAELKVRHAMIQTGSAGMTIANAINTSGGSLYFGGGYDFTVSGLIKNDSTGARTLGLWEGAEGSRTITLDNLDTNGQNVNFEARGGTPATPNTGGGFIINGAITGAGGISTVTNVAFIGNTVTLNGTNTYTGATNQVSGTIAVGSTGSITATSSVSVNGGLLSVQNGGSLNTTGATTVSGGTLSVAGTLTTTGATTVGGGTLSVAGTLTTTGATTVGGGTLSVAGTYNAASTGITVGGGSAGTLAVASTGSVTTTGTLTLGGGNTSNIFTIASGGSVSSGSVANPWGTTYTIDGTLNTTGGWTISTNATRTLGGSGTANAASFTTGNISTTVNYSLNALNLSGNLTVAGGNAGTAVILINQSAGTINTTSLLLGDNNNNGSRTYTMTGGRMNIGSGGIASIGSSNATRAINLGVGTVGARGADWNSSMNMSLTDAATGTTFNTLDSADDNTARNISLSGVLSGTGKLVKESAGTLTLTGDSTYTGDTSVNGGTLVVTGSLAATAVTVGSAATLGGNGNIAGSVTIQDGGRHALAVAATTGAQITRNITGVLDLSSASDILDLTAAAPPAAGVYILATATDGIIGVPDTINQEGVSGTFTKNGNSLELIVASVTNYSTWATTNGVPGQAANLDHDNDGVPNSVEYFIGGSTGNTTGFTPLPSVTTTSEVRSITWTKAASYTGTYGTDFVIETSTSLSDAWTVEASGVNVTISGDNVTYVFPAGPAKNFARLKVTGP